MKIILKSHLKIRLKERKIPQNYPEKILSKPDAKYFDTLRNRPMAVKSLKYEAKIRPMVIAYDIIGEEFQILTVYPTNEQEINNRLKSGRWIKYEAN